jgi:hypothetical protein
MDRWKETNKTLETTHRTSESCRGASSATYRIREEGPLVGFSLDLGFVFFFFFFFSFFFPPSSC